MPPFKKTLLDAMPFIDFLFGNETEARAFADSENWGTQDIPEIALKVTPSKPCCFVGQNPCLLGQRLCGSREGVAFPLVLCSGGVHG